MIGGDSMSTEEKIKAVKDEYKSKLKLVKEDLKRSKDILEYDYKKAKITDFSKEEFKGWLIKRQDSIYAGYIIEVISLTEQALKKIYKIIFDEKFKGSQKVIGSITEKINSELNLVLDYGSIKDKIEKRNLLIHEEFTISKIKGTKESYAYVNEFIVFFKDTFKDYFKQIKRAYKSET